MGLLFRTSIILLLLAAPLAAQTTQYPPYVAGMRLIVGAPGVLPRNTPDLNGLCGKDNHPCTSADAVPPGIYGVVQNDPPVFNSAGWWWVYVNYENGQVGWSTGYPPYLNALSPPQMAQGFSFKVAGDYSGATLTQGICIKDGVESAAQLNLQPNGTGQSGVMYCTWTTPPNGNHITVIKAVNNVGSAPSAEFQFSVTAQAVPLPPAAPINLRITPLTDAVSANTTVK